LRNVYFDSDRLSEPLTVEMWWTSLILEKQEH